MDDALEYAKALYSYSWWLMTAAGIDGAIAACGKYGNRIASFFKRKNPQKRKNSSAVPSAVPRSIYIIIPLLSLLIMSFLAWRDLNQTMHQREKYRSVIAELQRFISEGTAIQNRCIGHPSLPPLPPGKTVDDEYAEWAGRLHKFVEGNEHIKEYLPTLENVLVLGNTIKPLDGMNGPEAHAWRFVEAYMTRIGELVKKLELKAYEVPTS